MKFSYSFFLTLLCANLYGSDNTQKVLPHLRLASSQIMSPSAEAAPAIATQSILSPTPNAAYTVVSRTPCATVIQLGQAAASPLKRNAESSTPKNQKSALLDSLNQHTLLIGQDRNALEKVLQSEQPKSPKSSARANYDLTMCRHLKDAIVSLQSYMCLISTSNVIKDQQIAAATKAAESITKKDN